MVREYIGARYVPKFMGPYDVTQEYEALCVVDNGSGTSYISKIPTPAGTPLTDTNHWAIYGASSGAIINLQNQIDNLPNKMSIIDCENPPAPLVALIPDTNDDNTSALQALVDYCSSNKKVLLLHGKYAVSGTITIKGQTNIVGTGGDYSNRDEEYAFYQSSAIIRRMGTFNGPVFETDPTKNITGVNISNIGIYGNEVAQYGIKINRMRHSSIRHISITDVPGTALYLKPNGTSISDDNIMQNVFEQIYINRCYDGLYLGDNSNGNCYDNLFIEIRCDVFHVAGIFEGGDNNTFIHLSWYGRGSGADSYAWHLDGAGFVSNVFYHLQGRPKAINGSVNSIYEYDRENNDGIPYIDSSSKLFYTSNSRNGVGTVNSNNTQRVSIPVEDCNNTVPKFSSVDDNWMVLKNINSGIHAAIGLNTTTRRLVVAFSGDGNNASTAIELDRNSIYFNGHRISFTNSGSFHDGDILLNSSPTVGGYIGRVVINDDWHDFGAIV